MGDGSVMGVKATPGLERQEVTAAFGISELNLVPRLQVTGDCLVSHSVAS